MIHPSLLRPDESVLVVVDIQEKLLPAIAENEAVMQNGLRLIRAAGLLQVPILLTEQYPKGLGPTVEPVREALAEAGGAWRSFEKTAFAATGLDDFLDALEELDREQIVLCGIEAHVCIAQTALDLVEQGQATYVADDAVGSRNPAHHELARARLRQAGIIALPTESVLFEWLEDSAHPSFKAVSGLLK